MSDQKRTYRKTRRADLEEQTRLRITESAVTLHEELGPARTSISAVAERAGVRRSTVYRHFPDDEALFEACSSHFGAANPPPDPGTWVGIEDPAERTETALRELYAFYGRTERMYTSLLRDEPLVPIVHRRLGDFYGHLRVIEDSLMAGRGLRGRAARRTRAALGHALAFPTWRSLTREHGLADGDAIDLMCVLVEASAAARSGAATSQQSSRPR
jgi:AcrR family transcriptional regulator